MSEFSLESIYGSSLGGLAYNDDSGDIYIGVDRVVKRTRIRSSESIVLSLVTEAPIKSISVDKGLLLVLDESCRIYLYTLAYDVEIGRMRSERCNAAVIKDGLIYLEYEGFLQEWVAESNGFFSFKKTKHIIGHRDAITLLRATEDGILTSGYDGMLRFYDLNSKHTGVAQGKSSLVHQGRVESVGARKIGSIIVSVLANGEISRLYKEKGIWRTQLRKFTMVNLKAADISAQGDLVAVLDTAGNVLLFNTLSEDKEPLRKIFVSPKIKEVKFIEEDEWIMLSGDGTVVWEWRADTLLFNEQNSTGQVVARECQGLVVSGGVNGEVFLWDKGSCVCMQKVVVHTSQVVEILSRNRGFISVASNGVCKVHNYNGDVLKSIDSERVVVVADADEDILVLAGVGFVDVYDIKRGKRIMEKEIDIPLSIKIVDNLILVITNNGLVSIGQSSSLLKDGEEPFVLADISHTKTGVQICCLGESGKAYTFNKDLEEGLEYRAVPEYKNGLGRYHPLSMKYLESGALVVTYAVDRPDRQTGARQSLYAAMYWNGYEVERWIVQERLEDKEMAKVFTTTSIYGYTVGVCTRKGVFVFSDRARGLKPSQLWQKESPKEMEKKIREGDALSGAVFACRAQNKHLLSLALSLGNPALLGQYFPSELIPSLFPVVLSLLADGLVESSLVFLKEILLRAPAPPLLKKQLSLLLGPAINVSMTTTGAIDALQTYPHLKESN
ncbi:hypothetical protein NEHOM01_1225 [Nematocida homosporus]|uniref:uncharacterized protein n=1 Tax=Nematocida homosporus TaxID=1912981 RepID=UPI00221E47CE|nr:uncharacterized protein NEHOM01_1225 [Nematocida homosporus]KAI5186022.1 hypothetical protein NEHOM01_1225 [Nematocida homosporus]